MSQEERENHLKEIRERIVKGLVPNKPVFFQSNICDCEHEGDVWRAECEVGKLVVPMGGEVTDSYWDGSDCGEAWVTFKIPYNIDNIMKLLEMGEFSSPWQ